MVEVQGNPVKKFIIKQFLPLGFAIAVAWALAWPQPGHDIYAIKVGNGWKLVSTINICIIFLIFGLTLETSDLKAAFKNTKVLIMGIVMILVITSLTGFVPVNMNFQPPEFGIGLAIFACAPTSLSQGVTVVIQGYGNAALGLLLVVTTNLIGIFVTPIFVKLVLGSLDAKLDAVDLLIKLLVQILVPLLAGKALREFVKPALVFAKKFKVPLYMFTNFQVIMIVWQTLSYSQDKLLKQKGIDIFGSIMAAILQHVFFLFMATVVGWLFRMKEAERKAFIIMSAQKSLPTAVVIISYLNSPGLDVGLISIPCIVFYVLQLFIDSFIATGWASKFEKADELRHKYQKELDELAVLDPEGFKLDDKPLPSAAAPAGLAGKSFAKGMEGTDEDRQGLLSAH